MKFLALALVLACAPLIGACAVFRPAALPVEPPPLVDLEEPRPLLEEPDDEELRQDLDAGLFTGLYAEDARESLEAMMGEPEGLAVGRVVENSPAEASGLQSGDLLLEVRVGESGEWRTLSWPSEWRALELESSSSEPWMLLVDRAGAELEIALQPVPRQRSARRTRSARYREELRVGLVVRTATEVEAREAGLAPGAGVVVVGLSRASPWRAAGVRFEDLVVAVDGEPVAHPQVLLDAIRSAPDDAELELELVREGENRTLGVPLTQRESHLKHFGIPLVLRYERDEEERRFTLLFGLVGWKRTAAAWRMRLLWLITFGGGDSDRLEEVSS